MRNIEKFLILGAMLLAVVVFIGAFLVPQVWNSGIFENFIFTTVTGLMLCLAVAAAFPTPKNNQAWKEITTAEKSIPGLRTRRVVTYLIVYLGTAGIIVWAFIFGPPVTTSWLLSAWFGFTYLLRWWYFESIKKYPSVHQAATRLSQNTKQSEQEYFSSRQRGSIYGMIWISALVIVLIAAFFWISHS